MNNNLHIGTFDSERYWDSPDTARLPFFEDTDGNIIVSIMDELLFPFCNNNDILITRMKMKDEFLEYLKRIGFEFKNNFTDLFSNHTHFRETLKITTLDLLLNKKELPIHHINKEDDKTSIENYSILPYSVLPGDKKIAEKHKLNYDLPDVNSVIKVNSKIYSTAITHQFADQFRKKSHGEPVFSALELKKKGNQLLLSSSIMVKEDFGVSGRGNLLINNEKLLNRIVKHFIHEEEKGKEVKLVLEKFLDKDNDFSCQLKIQKNGEFQILGIQKIINNNFGYQGSKTATDDFVAFLDKNGYFQYIENVINQIYIDGYWGYVCIDSMVLKNNEIIPIIEINARKSMGLINHTINLYLSNYNVNGKLLYLSLGYQNLLTFNDLMEKLKSEELLFNPNKRKGILPLTSNTIFVNRDTSIETDVDKNKYYKGRFYFSVIDDNDEEKEVLIKRLVDLFLSLNFKVFNII